MKRTQKELEKLFKGRRVRYAYYGLELPDDGKTVEFTVTGVRRYAHITALLGCTDEAVFVSDEEIDSFLAGEEIDIRGILGIKTMALLPEEVEPTAPESAKSTLPAKWEERWWDVYLHLYKGGIAVPYCASGADDVVAFARKYLEGEP